jgi:hypothetical protein
MQFIYKVEEKLYLGVGEHKGLNTTALETSGGVHIITFGGKEVSHPNCLQHTLLYSLI